MNLYEKQAELRKAFDSAKSFADVDAIKKQLDEVTKQIKDAEAADAALKAAGGHGVAGGMTLGQYAAKNLDFSKLKGARGTVGTEYGYKANTDIITGSQIVQTSTNVVDVIPRPLMVRDLFGAETVSGNALQYYVLSATEGAPAVTAEGAAKPQISVPHTSVTVALDKVACFFKESDEITEDAAFLVSAIDNRGTYEHDSVWGVLPRLQTARNLWHPGDPFATSAQDSIFAGMTVQLATGYTADAIVINPADYQTCASPRTVMASIFRRWLATGPTLALAQSSTSLASGVRPPWSPNVARGHDHRRQLQGCGLRRDQGGLWAPRRDDQCSGFRLHPQPRDRPHRGAPCARGARPRCLHQGRAGIRVITLSSDDGRLAQSRAPISFRRCPEDDLMLLRLQGRRVPMARWRAAQGRDHQGAQPRLRSGVRPPPSSAPRATRGRLRWTLTRLGRPGATVS